MADEQNQDHQPVPEFERGQCMEKGSGVASLLQEKPTSGSVSPTTGISFGLAVTIAFLSSFITAGSMLVAYDHFIAQKIVSVDLKGFIAQTRDEFVAGKITDEQMRTGFDRMESVVKKIGKNKVVLMGDAVIQGVTKIEIGPNIPNQQDKPQ